MESVSPYSVQSTDAWREMASMEGRAGWVTQWVRLESDGPAVDSCEP